MPAANVANHVHDLAHTGSLATLVNNGQIAVDAGGNGPGAHYTTHIGTDYHDIFASISFLDVFCKQRSGVEVVNRNIKKSLYLTCMQIHGENTVSAALCN